MTACNICFMSAPPLVDYALEKQLGVQLAYQIHNLGMLSADHALQHVATDVGNPILDNWPFRLRGYNYRFFVLDSDDIDAIGLPSGLVYLNRGLLESVESDAELEVIVAHEIARTEQRYGLEVYKQLENDRRNAVQNTLVAGMSAALVSKGDYRVKNALTAGLGADFVSHLVYKVLHEGYPRGLEYEADAITLLYLYKRYGQLCVSIRLQSHAHAGALKGWRLDRRRWPRRPSTPDPFHAHTSPSGPWHRP